jgi:hypothetical protein
MMGDVEQLVVALMQSMSATGSKWHVDGEIGNLAGMATFNGSLLRYQRYDVRLTSNWLSGGGRADDVRAGKEVQRAARQHGILEEPPGWIKRWRERWDKPPRENRYLRRVQELINVNGMPTLQSLGIAAAKEQVQADHFPAIFDRYPAAALT